MEITVGCDPEVFVWDTEQKVFVCGEGLIPGDKQNPYPVEGGAVQVDGTALEFNINPASTKVEFVGNVVRVFDTLKAMVSTSNHTNLEIKAIPLAEFNKPYFKSLSKKALMLGCEPDYDAYTGQPNNPPAPPRGSTARTASGHVHVGWGTAFDPKDPDHIAICCEVAQQLDWFVGYPSIYFASPPEERIRRSLYGMAGAFRPKSYGLEYRTPSNGWLKNEETIGYIYDQTIEAMREFDSGRYLPKYRPNYSIEYAISQAYRDNRFFSVYKIARPPGI